MKTGRTNAITISGGGGTTINPYDKWQEGFNANWDSVIQNAPQTGVDPVLHIYNKVNSIRHKETFPTSATIVTYNPTTSIYRPVVVDANKNLFFEESDFFINNSDGMSYTCVIYKVPSSWDSNYFGTTLPIVYSNTKFCTSIYMDGQISLITPVISLYPFLRGIDCYNPNVLYISAWLEHLTVSVYQSSISLAFINGSDTQVRVLKKFVENAPANTNFTLNYQLLNQPTISDNKLADWFYNDFFYKNFNGTAYGAQTGVTTKNVIKFKINSNILLTGAYQLYHIPNCIYLDGTFTENQLNNNTSAGLHSFNNPNWTMLQNFPMWTVLEGATTGCLLPVGNVNSTANFIFYSKNLERKYFCEFDENGTIIEDPTKYFLCNLPVQQHVSGQIIRFVTNTFWSLFTADEIIEIERYIGLKNWGISWQ